MRKYYEWIDVARGIGMFLVVFGHALSDSFLGVQKGSGVPSILFRLIYSFHMPLFFFLSGFLSKKLLEDINFNGKIEYIRKRFFRLMIPYIFVGILYIPLNIIFSKFTSTSENGNVFLNFLFGVNPNFQLWTLYALFLCGSIICVFSFISKKLLFLISIFLYVLSSRAEFEIHIINDFFENFIFYVSGLLFYKKHYIEERKTSFVLERKESLFCLIIVFILANYFKKYNFIWDFNLFSILAAFCGIFIVIILAQNIIKFRKNFLINFNYKFWTYIGKYAMDIYILANLPQVLSRTIFVKIMRQEGYVAVLISLIIGIAMPIFASKFIIRKSKILRRLILGSDT